MLRFVDTKYNDLIFPQLWTDENVKTFLSFLADASEHIDHSYKCFQGKALIIQELYTTALTFKTKLPFFSKYEYIKKNNLHILPLY
jgi:hypothetical protein